MIDFEHLCHFPLHWVKVTANIDGSDLKIVDGLTKEEVQIEELKTIDRLNIRELVSDWAQYYKDMREVENYPQGPGRERTRPQG